MCSLSVLDHNAHRLCFGLVLCGGMNLIAAQPSQKLVKALYPLSKDRPCRLTPAGATVAGGPLEGVSLC